MKTAVKFPFAILALALTVCAQAQIPVLNNYPTAKATVYLDFDGQFVAGTIWNNQGPILARPSDLSAENITEIFNDLANDFRPFNLNITTDSVVYNKAPVCMRVRIIFTSSSEWYGNSAGASLIGSFSFGDNTPAWVFENHLGNNPKYIAAAAAHQIGHSMGLLHQSVYDSQCRKISEYNGGEGTDQDGWAPIMGAGFYKNIKKWITGTSSMGCGSIQNDMETIAGVINNFGYRKEPRTIALQGMIQKNEHGLNWKPQSSTGIDHYEIEVSSDSLHFEKLISLPAGVLNYDYIPQSSASMMYYRIKGWSDADNVTIYSNIITLIAEQGQNSIQLMSNFVKNLLNVRTNGSYAYQILDASGRLLAKGTLQTGMNSIPVDYASSGMLFFRWEAGHQQGVQKLIKQ